MVNILANMDAPVAAVSIRAEVTAQAHYVISILGQVELFAKNEPKKMSEAVNYVMLF